MSDTIITVENLSKKYLIGHKTGQQGRSRYVALRDVIGREVRNLARKTVDMARGRQLLHGEEVEEFWALKDVSFEVKRGEVLGIIGRNGAGKSTLLKILSRITEPTEGRVTLRGRVASLLEVGTGFHPELTGRENIFLNGAILGMTCREITAKFDEIVAFAEVEKFLDTPVKHYSSGMYVRLAFAVAAHLEPEILVVDEVLAVGDTEFQKKCLGKMDEVSRNDGRTVLFVSHNFSVVGKLCPRALLFDNGKLKLDNCTASVLTAYLLTKNNTSQISEVDLTTYQNRYGSGELKISAARLLDHNGNPSGVLHRLKPASLEVTITGQFTGELILSAICMTKDNLRILQLTGHDSPGFAQASWSGSHIVRAEIRALPLQCGDYQWAFGVHSSAMNPIDVVLDILPFKVDDDLSASPRPFRSVSENGFCSLLARWSCNVNDFAMEPASLAAEAVDHCDKSAGFAES